MSTFIDPNKKVLDPSIISSELLEILISLLKFSSIVHAFYKPLQYVLISEQFDKFVEFMVGNLFKLMTSYPYLL